MHKKTAPEKGGLKFSFLEIVKGLFYSVVNIGVFTWHVFSFAAFCRCNTS